jgi:hypothetical protein
MTKTDRVSLNVALTIIRAAHPTATKAVFETSDQNVGYGFWLLDVWLPDLSSAEMSPKLTDDVNDLLVDVDWDDVMGEDGHGFAVVEL